MKVLSMLKWLAAVMSLVMLQCSVNWAQEGPEKAQPSATPSPPEAKTTTAREGTLGATKEALLVDDVLKMAKAGVATEVIRAYIEHVPAAPPPSARDLIALKESGLPDDLSVALVKRAAELATPPGQVNATNTPPRQPIIVSVAATGGRMDPESYDFWWYHYAYPRALASANERMLSAYAPGSRFLPNSYGYYPPPLFRPQAPGRFLRLQ